MPAGDLHYLSAVDAVGQLDFCMTYPFNILGRLPVMSFPIGLAASTGVPIGMQIVGPVNADLVPHRVAASLEAEQGPFFDTHLPSLGAAS